jgi:hypothetical protein
MMQTSGCSICMKVCPVQRYGLRAVLDEYRRSGQILGKDTDDLEGFDWPLDGRLYGPNEKPHVPASVVRPPGFNLDPTRTEPQPTRRIPMVSSAACSSSIHRKNTLALMTRGMRSYITWFTTM